MSLEPVDPALQAMIDAEPSFPVNAELEARLLSRLEVSIDAAVAAGAAGSLGARALLKKLGGGALLYLLGLGTGVVLQARFAPEAPVQPAPAVVAPAPKIEAPVPQPPLQREVIAPVGPPAPRPRPVPVVETPAPLPVATLEAERRLLEPARTAIGRGLPASALELLARHAAQFPAGQLAEEREALWIQALAQSSELEGARARAAAFEKSYPDSLFLPIVKRALTP